jgi:hypothetical protein
MLPRMAKKPLCICAHAERAWARAATSWARARRPGTVRQVFGNRQRIGDGAVLGLSSGTLPVGECLSSRSRVSGWLSLISSSYRGAGQFERQGAAQRPGGKQFVADDQVIGSCSGPFDEGTGQSASDWQAAIASRLAPTVVRVYTTDVEASLLAMGSTRS